MSKKDDALNYHQYPRPGKIQVIPTKPHSTQRDLARSCRTVPGDREKSFGRLQIHG